MKTTLTPQQIENYRRDGFVVHPGFLSAEEVKELKTDVREGEPYVHSQSTHSHSSKKFGRSRVPWLSGTASWSYFAATQYILGIRPEQAGLRLDPCIPAAWPGFTVTRQFRDKKLKITVENPNGIQKGVAKLVLNGQELPGNLIPVEALKPVNKIQVVMG